MNHALPQHQAAMRVGSDFRIMRDHDDRLAVFVEPGHLPGHPPPFEGPSSGLTDRDPGGTGKSHLEKANMSLYVVISVGSTKPKFADHTLDRTV